MKSIFATCSSQKIKQGLDTGRDVITQMSLGCKVYDTLHNKLTAKKSAKLFVDLEPLENSNAGDSLTSEIFPEFGQADVNTRDTDNVNGFKFILLKKKIGRHLTLLMLCKLPDSIGNWWESRQ